MLSNQEDYVRVRHDGYSPIDALKPDGFDWMAFPIVNEEYVPAK